MSTSSTKTKVESTWNNTSRRFCLLRLLIETFSIELDLWRFAYLYVHVVFHMPALTGQNRIFLIPISPATNGLDVNQHTSGKLLFTYYWLEASRSRQRHLSPAHWTQYQLQYLRSFFQSCCRASLSYATGHSSKVGFHNPRSMPRSLQYWKRRDWMRMTLPVSG